MKKLLLFVFAAAVVGAAGTMTYKVANSKPATLSLLAQNLQALTDPAEDGEKETDRKLTVCLCSDKDVTTGYYQFSEMKNHCHDGVGRSSCAGKVYDCNHTWHCDL